MRDSCQDTIDFIKTLPDLTPEERQECLQEELGLIRKEKNMEKFICPECEEEVEKLVVSVADTMVCDDCRREMAQEMYEDKFGR